jgi:antitoxin PrlF
MPKLEAVSTITTKGQTTVPKAVRKILGVDAGGRIAFEVEGDQVTLRRVDPGEDHEDPVLDRFLELVAQDLERRPHAVRPLSRGFAGRMRALSRGRRVDPEAPIDGEVDL